MRPHRYPIGTVCRVHAGWADTPTDNPNHGRVVRIIAHLPSMTGTSEPSYSHVCLEDPRHNGKGVGTRNRNSECYLTPLSANDDMVELP